MVNGGEKAGIQRLVNGGEKTGIQRLVNGGENTGIKRLVNGGERNQGYRGWLMEKRGIGKEWVIQYKEEERDMQGTGKREERE